RVDAAVGGAAVVLHLHVKGGSAVGIGGGRVGEGSRDAHGRRHGEQRRIADIADDVGQHRLRRLVKWTGRERGHPIGHGLGPAVFVDYRRIVGGERGSIVDRDNGQARGRGIDAVTRRADARRAHVQSSTLRAAGHVPRLEGEGGGAVVIRAGNKANAR